MLKLTIYAVAAYLLWTTGTWGYAILAYVAWEFVKGAQGGGGVAGGVQAVALKAIFAGMLYVALVSPAVHGSTAVLLGMAGAIGLMVQKFPTFKLRKQIREGMEADKARDAANARSEGQRKTGEAIAKSLANGGDGSDAAQQGAELDEQAVERTSGADTQLASVRDGMSKEQAPGQRRPGGQQSFLSWFINGSDGRSNGKKQGVVSWFFFGSKGAPANSKQSALGWFFKGADPRRQGGGLVSWFLFGTPVKKKSKRK
ncbi:hypothetical protein [Roseateles sp. MS654]|uniref:hypothetical protein n=1 Tax=Roseateles sp. MS654 TaxID=3412685 RepID=UPI003C304075